MKLLLILILFISHQMIWGYSKNDPNHLIEEMLMEVEEVQFKYNKQYLEIYDQLSSIDHKLRSEKETDIKINLLIEKSILNDKKNILISKEKGEISKIRYLKGLSIIRLLYGKILSLDHHFSAVTTFRDINNISNPNSYPEFIQIKEDLKNNQDKRNGFDLTEVLGSNIYTSVIHTFVSMLTTSKSDKNKNQEQIENVECILDFTLRMHNDLKTIYFETSFLQERNKNMHKDLIELFDNFTKPIDYNINLKKCRDTDDWESVRKKLDEYLAKLNNETDDINQIKIRKMLINLEFPIDRLLQFIIQYNDYINQGTNFYEKFKIMLTSYEVDAQCASKTPLEFTKLKNGVDVTIEKFNTAYKPVEINGTKLKEILYGINEYD